LGDEPVLTMTGVHALLLITLALIVAGMVELGVHRRNLRRIPIRIHVNGTRGKSSVTRLIAAALRQAGKVTCAKTTGTLARMILPDGREVPIFRPAGPSIIEQKRIVAAAAACGAEALVIECMALQPELQALSEARMLNATHGVITNARPDHLEVMGPTDAHVARALSGMVPVKGRLYTAERRQLLPLREAAQDRGTELVVVEQDEVLAVTAAELGAFSYTEHPDNVALALRLCADLGISRELALRGMQQCRPDPGAFAECHLDFFGKSIVFFNGFAANDPVSTRQLWELAIERTPTVHARIAIFNCRADRPDRSLQLGSQFVHWAPADFVVLMGTGTYIFSRAATRAGYDSSRLVLVEELHTAEIFERVVSLVESSALIMGMGNIGGHGLDLARYFSNRAQPRRQHA
jgi:poly-gamma-glutamate synthase PgsB/CapB